MALNIKNMFDVDLPAAMAKNPEKACVVGHLYQVNITGPEGGNWTVNLTKNNDGPYCRAGEDKNAECTITLNDSDFKKLVEQPQAVGMQLFFSQKLKVEGNQMLLMKTQRLFELAK